MKRAVIITGGGSGTRMGTLFPKQFLTVCNKPLIVHTIGLFAEFDSDMTIVVVIPPDYIETWQKISETYLKDLNISIATGGETRFHSVKNGLKLIDSERIIGVHDAVRPLVTKEVIGRCYEIAEKVGNAIPVTGVPESIRRVNDDKSFPMNRDDLRLIQTPQVFRGDILKQAYETPYMEEFTDDASVVEKMGVKIHLVEGNRGNIKVTTKEDLEWVECVLGRRDNLYT